MATSAATVALLDGTEASTAEVARALAAWSRVECVGRGDAQSDRVVFDGGDEPEPEEDAHAPAAHGVRIRAKCSGTGHARASRSLAIAPADDIIVTTEYRLSVRKPSVDKLPFRSAATERSRTLSPAPGFIASGMRTPRHIGWFADCSSNHASGEAASNGSDSSAIETVAPSFSKSSVTNALSPHAGAARRYAGGESGVIAPRRIIAASAIGPVVLQVVMTTRPPGRTTRSISFAAISASGAKITANTDTSASNVPSAAGIALASPAARRV